MGGCGGARECAGERYRAVRRTFHPGFEVVRYARWFTTGFAARAAGVALAFARDASLALSSSSSASSSPSLIQLSWSRTTYDRFGPENGEAHHSLLFLRTLSVSRVPSTRSHSAVSGITSLHNGRLTSNGLHLMYTLNSSHVLRLGSPVAPSHANARCSVARRWYQAIFGDFDISSWASHLRAGPQLASPRA